MDSQNILKTALGVGILGTLAVFLTYSYSGDDTSEMGETNEGSENVDTTQETATTMEASSTKEDGSMASFWKTTYNNITNKE